MGVPKPFQGDRAAVRRAIGRDTGTIVASFGYLLPHKGLRELIRGFALLRETIEDAHLLMLNALYPVAHSEEEMHACLDELRRLDLRDNVTLVTDFLSEQDVVARLSAADVIVYPYQHTQESASAAVKMGLGSLTPIAVTPLPIFDDILNVSYVLPGTAPESIAEGLVALLSNSAGKSHLMGRQRKWVEAHEWSAVSARLDGLIRGELDARVPLTR